MDVDFSDILENSRAFRSKQEAINSPFGNSIPRLERALPQIDNESRRLATRTASRIHTFREDEARALRLLSQFGFETNKIQSTLDSSTLLHAFEPLQSVGEADLDSYLARLHQISIASAIESSIQQSTKGSMSILTATVQAEWDTSKRHLVTLTPAQYRSHPPTPFKNILTSSGASFASPFPQLRMPGRRNLHPASTDLRHRLPKRIYQSIVTRAVYSRGSRNTPISIASEFDIAIITHLAPRGDPLCATKNVQHLHALFTALRCITGEATSRQPSEASFSTMRFMESWRNVCQGAYRFLCLQFREEKMKREIEARPVEAKRGGNPGLMGDIRAYLNLIFKCGVPEQLARGSLHDGMPVWPQVYYSLRCGCSLTALDVLSSSLQKGCNDACVRLFAECLHAIHCSGDKRSLPRSLLESLIQDYGLSAKRGDDPYQRVCYVVVARLDPAAGSKMALRDSDYALLFYSIEDYLWLRLSVAHVEGDKQLPECLSIYQLSFHAIGEEMKRFGPAHFDTQGDAPVFYALVLLLTGQFSEAIEYLDQGDRASAEAFHVAFTLYYYGLVEDSEAAKGGITRSIDTLQSVEYSKLLWRYVCRFSKSEARLAVVYIFTLRDKDVRNDLLVRLILDTKEFDELLGWRGAGGVQDRQEIAGGVLEEVWGLSISDTRVERGWVSVVEQAAQQAEGCGDYDSAVVLYEVAGVRGKVMKIHIDRISGVLTSRGCATRRRIFDEAKRYEYEIHNMDKKEVFVEKLLPSLQLLLSVGRFFDLLWAERYEQARILIYGAGVLPVEDAQLVTKTREVTTASGVWVEGVCDRIAEILLGTMEVLAALYGDARRGGSECSISTDSLRRLARTLVNFSGMIYNPSADISGRLVRLEVLMS